MKRTKLVYLLEKSEKELLACDDGKLLTIPMKRK